MPLASSCSAGRAAQLIFLYCRMFWFFSGLLLRTAIAVTKLLFHWFFFFFETVIWQLFFLMYKLVHICANYSSFYGSWAKEEWKSMVCLLVLTGSWIYFVKCKLLKIFISQYIFIKIFFSQSNLTSLRLFRIEGNRSIILCFSQWYKFGTMEISG